MMACNKTNSWRSLLGFTIAEVLVVVTVTSVLAGFVFFNVNESRKQGRDAERKANLQAVAAALEDYKRENGRYPTQCAGGSGGWSGQIGTNYACTGGSRDYIVGLAPQYIPRLPYDETASGNQGYVYRVNSDGSVYKFMALDVVETEVVTLNHQFSRCPTNDTSTDICSYKCSVPNCPSQAGISSSDVCRDDNTYAVYGGRAIGADNNDNTAERQAEYYTEQVLCR